MPVDPWGGFNKGLASLNDAFDTMEARRVRQEEMDRQARIDALQEPILRAQGEDAALSMEEKRRKITDLRAYDEARKQLERNPGTVPTMTEQDNPDYKPPVPEGLNSSLDYFGERNEVIPGRPAEGLPTMQVAGERPPTNSEMARSRIDLAIQHGQYDEIPKISNILDVTDKITAHESTQFAKVVANAKANMFVIGRRAAELQLKRDAAAMGEPPEVVNSISLNNDGIVSYSDGQGGSIVVVPTPDGKYKVQHVTEKRDTEKYGTATTAEGVYSYNQRTGQRGERLGSPKPDAGNGTGAPKVGTVGQVSRSLIRRYLPIAKMNLEGKPDAPKILEGINLSIGSADQFGGSVNDARLYEALSPSQRAGYDWVKAQAEEYSKTMPPEAAVEKAWKEGMAERKKQTAAKPAPTVAAPSGYAPTNKMHNGKPLYFNPKAPKGKEYWTP